MRAGRQTVLAAGLGLVVGLGRAVGLGPVVGLGLVVGAGLAVGVGPACAAAPDVGKADAPREPQYDETDRDHWAFRPLSVAAPPAVDDPRFGAHPIDRFVKARLDAAGIEPLPRAGRTAQLRRLAFDLTGLPPPGDAVRTDSDPAPSDELERFGARLLESRAYAQRRAQHWLDLARYAETDGFEHDLIRPNAWRYRDWVIEAFDRDLPWAEFVALQLAGDELRPGDPDAAVATGFLLCGPDMPDLNLQEERRHQVLNELTATVGAVFLALQMGCAQCHDHKYDPISQYDFYRLRAFFDSCELFGEQPIPSPTEAQARRAAEAAWSPEDHARAKRRGALEDLARRKFREKNPDEQPPLELMLEELEPSQRSEHAELVARLDALPALPPLPRGRVVRRGAAQESRLLLAGDFRRPGPELRWGFPQILSPTAAPKAGADAACDGPDKGSGQEGAAAPALRDDDPTPAAIEASPGATGDGPEPSRAVLARWLVEGGGRELAARVIVNRVWQWHFGVGLAESSSDFGLTGLEPAHPELLDWLARWFLDQGGSFRELSRLIVASETYRLASGPYDPDWSADEQAAAAAIARHAESLDPENRLLWRRHRGRLDAESIRDAMLASCGRLSPRRGGPGVRPPLPPEVAATLLKDQWPVSPDEEDHRRRSIYLFVRRNLRLPLLDVFDRPDTNATCPRRHESTTAPQSLVLFNSAFSIECARALAGAAIAAAGQARQSRAAAPAFERSAAGEAVPTALGQPPAACAVEAPAAQGAPEEVLKRQAAWIADVYRRVLARRPTTAEIDAGLAFLKAERTLLADQGRTAASLAVPIWPAGPAGASAAAGVDPLAAAALIDFCLALYNASEFVYLD